MNKILVFIQKTKAALGHLESYKNVHIVLGNESGDLDSVVSALVEAYLIYTKNEEKKPEPLVIPVMNVLKCYFHLRTETCYLLKKCNIDYNMLIFKDQINYAEILKNRTVETTLVDHHVLSQQDKILEKTVVQIFDHRPINSDQICKGGKSVNLNIKTVGSCTTLIAKEVIESGIKELIEEVAYLVYATILYDTIGLDVECGRTFRDDVTTAEHLEQILKLPETRKQVFDNLWEVHNDTSTLTSKDLLYRDLKIARGIPMPGLPTLVQEYLARGDSVDALKSFIEDYSKKNLVLIGISAEGEVQRDIGIYYTEPGFKDTLVGLLNTSKQIAGENLKLVEISALQRPNLVLFKQGNIRLTRKFILPLVEEAARRFYNEN